MIVASAFPVRCVEYKCVLPQERLSSLCCHRCHTRSDVMPSLPASEVALFCALADSNGDGLVSLEDLAAAGRM